MVPHGLLAVGRKVRPVRRHRQGAAADAVAGADYVTKPRPEPPALAFQNPRPGQSHPQAVCLARPNRAWLGPAHGLKPGRNNTRARTTYG